MPEEPLDDNEGTGPIIEPDPDDVLDHPDSLSEDADDDETAALRPLFPGGGDDADKADEWKELFSDGT